MENTFFDEELLGTNYLVFCPNCKNSFKVGLENIEIVCECGEEFCAEPITSFTEDFVWHPSERY
jgi:hypothetical protein